MRKHLSAGLLAGHPPWDPWTGARVGGFSGGLIGALAAAGFGLTNLWLALVGAIVGAVIGYATEKRQQTAQRIARKPRVL